VRVVRSHPQRVRRPWDRHGCRRLDGQGYRGPRTPGPAAAAAFVSSWALSGPQRWRTRSAFVSVV